MRIITILLLSTLVLAHITSCVTKNAPAPDRNKAQAKEAVNDMNRAFN